MWSFSIEQVSSISLHNDPPSPLPQRKWDALLWCTSTVLRRNGTVLHSWKSPSLDTRKQQHTNTQKCPIRQRCRSACSQLFGAELQRTHSPTLFSMSSCFCKDASRWLPALLSIASPSFSGDLKPSAHTNNANRLNLMAVVSPLWQLCCGRLAFIQFTMICVDCGLYVHGCNLCACARAHTCTHTLTHSLTHSRQDLLVTTFGETEVLISCGSWCNMTDVTNTTVPTCANIPGGGVGQDERGTDISTAVSGTTPPTYANHPSGSIGEVKTRR